MRPCTAIAPLGDRATHRSGRPFPLQPPSATLAPAPPPMEDAGPAHPAARTETDARQSRPHAPNGRPPPGGTALRALPCAPGLRRRRSSAPGRPVHRRPYGGSHRPSGPARQGRLGPGGLSVLGVTGAAGGSPVASVPTRDGGGRSAVSGRLRQGGWSGGTRVREGRALRVQVRPTRTAEGIIRVSGGRRSSVGGVAFRGPVAVPIAADRFRSGPAAVVRPDRRRHRSDAWRRSGRTGDAVGRCSCRVGGALRSAVQVFGGGHAVVRVGSRGAGRWGVAGRVRPSEAERLRHGASGAPGFVPRANGPAARTPRSTGRRVVQAGTPRSMAAGPVVRAVVAR
jgi:hypothetical protein